MGIFSGLISGVAGIFGANKAAKNEAKAIAAQNAYNDPAQVRARAENAGFNPLAFIGPGVGQQTATGGSNYMGAAIANAGLALANGMDQAQMLKIEQTRLKQDQQKLDILLQNATIRPKTAGIYSGNVRAPSVGGVGSPKIPEMEGVNQYIRVYNPDSKKWTVQLNPDLLDAGPSEMAAGVAVGAAYTAAQHGEAPNYESLGNIDVVKGWFSPATAPKVQPVPTFSRSSGLPYTIKPSPVPYTTKPSRPHVVPTVQGPPTKPKPSVTQRIWDAWNKATLYAR